MQIIDINGQSRDCERILLDPQWPGFVTVNFISKGDPQRKHTEWYPVKEFLEKNPDITKKIGKIPTMAKDDLGIVTHCGETYLEDTTKNWKNNIYTGFYVWISRGVGESQVRLIKTNTKNSLTIDRAWDVLPNEKSQYVVSYNIHDVKILGNTLPQFQP